MPAPSTYANEARKKVGQYLVKEAGFSKKTPLKFYKQAENILTYVYLEKVFLTQVEVGITPLYIPDSVGVLNGVRLPNCALSEDCGPMQANQWTEAVIRQLQGGILSFMESIASPQALLHRLTDRSPSDHRFALNPLQTSKLIIFTSAYLGDIPSAIRCARRAIQQIKETRIDSLPAKLAQYDAEIARMKADLSHADPMHGEIIRQAIDRTERGKQLAESDAASNAASTIRMYEDWIAPFSDPSFDRMDYFAQIIRQNKDALKYEKLFKLKNP